MRSIYVAGIEFPIPDHWQVDDERLHAAGPEGILDARMYELDSAVDAERLAAARLHFPGASVTMELIDVRGEPCLYCAYDENQCRVLTFSLNRTGTEIRGVYVLRPGNESVAEEIRLCIE